MSTEKRNFITKTQTNSLLPADVKVDRAQTQKNVNSTTLSILADRLSRHKSLKMLDLPCGNMEFLGYLKTMFPSAELYGADIVKPKPQEGINFIEMDLSKDFTFESVPQFDLITSISGVMVFGNSQNFIENCAVRLKDNGTIIITNDNSATIIDRIAYLFIGRYRMFKAIFEDHEALTENVPVQELCRLLRTNNINIDNIIYTSFYRKDLVYLPFVLLVYPFQWLYLKRITSNLPKQLIREMYPFKHFFYKHYIIVGSKK